jgi:serine/threonine protein kinase
LANGYSGVKADIFALGVILFTLHFGVPPFSLADPKEDRLYKLLSHKSNSSDKKASMKFFLRSHPATKELLASNRIDYELMDLIISLLQENPCDRPADIHAIRAHPYFRIGLYNSAAVEKASADCLVGINEVLGYAIILSQK